MQANDRCKAHYQGDKCRKPKHHDSPVAETPDLIHVGINVAWNVQGHVVAKAVANKAPRRDLRLNKIIKNIDFFRRFNPTLAKAAINHVLGVKS